MKIKSDLRAGKVTLYGASWCPHCTHQKEFFDSKGIDYEFVDCADTSNACPDWVKAYPTTVVTGYTEF